MDTTLPRTELHAKVQVIEYIRPNADKRELMVDVPLGISLAAKDIADRGHFFTVEVIDEWNRQIYVACDSGEEDIASTIGVNGDAGLEAALVEVVTKAAAHLGVDILDVTDDEVLNGLIDGTIEAPTLFMVVVQIYNYEDKKVYMGHLKVTADTFAYARILSEHYNCAFGIVLESGELTFAVVQTSDNVPVSQVTVTDLDTSNHKLQETIKGAYDIMTMAHVGNC